MPHEMNGVPLRPWRRPPTSRREWNLLADEMFLAERLFHPPNGKIPAAGAVVVEPDGRVWLVSPTNQHGGGQQTFPKGTVSDLSLASTALKEVLDKTGLQIELMDHLLDVERGTSFTRYYLARRIGGTPAAMGWRSQAVHLVPPELVKERLNLPVDHPIVDKLMEVWGAWAGRYREPVERRPTPARRQTPKSPQAGTSTQHDELVALWIKQDADAIAASACKAQKAGNEAAVIKHCKHAAVVFHHQGKPGLAAFFARFVKQALEKQPPAEPMTAPSLFSEPLPAPSISAIRRGYMPPGSPIFEVQAKFMASLILDLEAACLRLYGVDESREIPWDGDLTAASWEVPEYRRFIEGSPACGFVVDGLPPEEWLDLEDVNRHPRQTIPIMRPQDIRLFIHTVHRSEKWADGYASPVLESLASGALQAVAKRLLEDDSLYEPH
jgi:ADP-ribose pyrophosphatase YjhB (NUDIX family)